MLLFLMALAIVVSFSLLPHGLLTTHPATDFDEQMMFLVAAVYVLLGFDLVLLLRRHLMWLVGAPLPKSRKHDNADRLVSELLAVVHRDGGHREKKVGRARALQEAITLWYEHTVVEDGDERVKTCHCKAPGHRMDCPRLIPFDSLPPE